MATAERKLRLCGHVDDLLPEMFPLMGRSGQGDSNGWVAGREIFLATEVA